MISCRIISLRFQRQKRQFPVQIRNSNCNGLSVDACSRSRQLHGDGDDVTPADCAESRQDGNKYCDTAARMNVEKTCGNEDALDRDATYCCASKRFPSKSVPMTVYNDSSASTFRIRIR